MYELVRGFKEILLVRYFACAITVHETYVVVLVISASDEYQHHIFLWRNYLQLSFSGGGIRVLLTNFNFIIH